MGITTSVKGRIDSIKQPRGGYIKPSGFIPIELHDSITLNEEENIHSSIIGMVVDYLTRFALGTDIEDAFRISIQGALMANTFGINDAMTVANDLLHRIEGLDDDSIVSACKLVSFDVWKRNIIAARTAKGYSEINPDRATIENVQALINRSIAFFKIVGPIIKDGFTFEPVKPNERVYEKMIQSGKGTYGGYTPTVETGDGDFLTADTLWDFKVSKTKPTNKQTLQLLMYWIMGQHSGQDIYKGITRLGIFNPRLNTAFLINVSSISSSVIKAVEDEVICY